jgi:hypothetical protein
MKKSEVLKLALEELKNPKEEWSLATLEAHTFIEKNGEIKFNSIDLHFAENLSVVYFAVKQANFYFAVYVDWVKRNATVSTAPWIRINYSATSDVVAGTELRNYIQIEKSKGVKIITHNKGDQAGETNTKYNFNTITIYVPSLPGVFAKKLTMLLDALLTDQEGLKKIGNVSADASINITHEYHNGTGFLGDFEIDVETIKKIEKLNVKLSFAFMASGQKILSPLDKKRGIDLVN